MNPWLVNTLNARGNTVIPPSAMRVYVAICKAADEGKTLTLREIARDIGKRSHNDVFVNVKGLRDAGLVSWDGSGRTIRPLYRLRMFVDQPTKGN